MSNPVAAIDCGTNAIRLLIAHRDPAGAVREVVREMRTVRLGEGVDRTGEFSAAALERTFAACSEYQALLMQHSVHRIRFIATSASRDVRNRSDFVAGVESIFGTTPEVITGEQEAELSYVGALSGFPENLPGPALVADIGGGSTEFVMRTDRYRAYSLNVGCVRMTERHLHSDPPTREEIDNTIADIHAGLHQVAQSLPVTTVQTFIGLAGSVTTMSAMTMGLDEYDPHRIHGSHMSLAQVEEVTDRLLRLTRAQRAELGFMHPGRVDVIGGGALVLRESMRVLGLSEVLVSEHDLLDGVVASLTP